MKGLMEQDNSLFGRFQLVLNVGEFEYWHAQSFYPQLEPKFYAQMTCVFSLLMTSLDYHSE